MSDYDSDNICGFDMDFDGDKDFYDDLIYDDITEHCSGRSDSDDDDYYGGSSYSGGGRPNTHRTSGTGSQDSGTHISISTIICIVFGIVTAVSSGSIMSGIVGVFVMWLIISYVKLFIL